VAGAPTDYEYDVFVSYKHGSLYGAWVEETLLRLFKELLREELPRGRGIFFDRTGMSAADAFPAKLKRALATSRCMVAVWTPSYFYDSPWCRTELSLMLYLGDLAAVSQHDLALRRASCSQPVRVSRRLRAIDCLFAII
jgi:hypothetical protein